MNQEQQTTQDMPQDARRLHETYISLMNDMPSMIDTFKTLTNAFDNAINGVDIFANMTRWEKYKLDCHEVMKILFSDSANCFPEKDLKIVLELKNLFEEESTITLGAKKRFVAKLEEIYQRFSKDQNQQSNM